jgi:hypothetical protein
MLVNNIKRTKKFHKFVSFTKPYPFWWATKRVQIEIYSNCGIPIDHKNNKCQTLGCNTHALPSKTSVWIFMTLLIPSYKYNQLVAIL